MILATHEETITETKEFGLIELDVHTWIGQLCIKVAPDTDPGMAEGYKRRATAVLTQRLLPDFLGGVL